MVSKGDPIKWPRNVGDEMNLLVLDIGGTFIKYSIFSLENESLGKVARVKTPLDNLENLLSTIGEIIQKQSVKLVGLAISLPGTIDSQSGYIYQGGSLHYNRNLSLAAIIQDRYQLETTIENDAHCAALAELWKGKLQDVSNGLVLVLGTGLGGAVLQNGRLYKGAHRYAAELSMIATKDFKIHGFDAFLGPQISVPQMIAEMNQLIGENLSGAEVFQRLEQGNPLLQKKIDEYLDNFARQIFNFQIAYDPEKILIGGGISKNKFFMSLLEQAVEKVYQVLPINIPHSPIECCHFESEANLLGAVKNFLIS